MLTRIRTWCAAGGVEKARAAARAHNASERDRIEEEAEGIKADRLAMSGDGSVAPLLPLGPADDLSEVFERNAHAPVDEAP